MPASHFDVNSMTGRPKFIVRHSTGNLKMYLTIGTQREWCLVPNSLFKEKKFFLMQDNA
jgi:hypothetical protein